VVLQSSSSGLSCSAVHTGVENVDGDSASDSKRRQTPAVSCSIAEASASRTGGAAISYNRILGAHRSPH
jgi:hypothetical protein